MTREEEFREDKKNLLEEIEEDLPVGLAEGLHELSCLVVSLKEVNPKVVSGTIVSTHFKELLENLEVALNLCLDEYSRLDRLRKLGDAMSQDVLNKYNLEKKKKIEEDMKHYNSKNYLFGGKNYE